MRAILVLALSLPIVACEVRNPFLYTGPRITYGEPRYERVRGGYRSERVVIREHRNGRRTRHVQRRSWLVNTPDGSGLVDIAPEPSDQCLNYLNFKSDDDAACSE